MTRLTHTALSICVALTLLAGLTNSASADVFVEVPYTLGGLSDFAGASFYGGQNPASDFADTPTLPYGLANNFADGADTGWIWAPAGGSFFTVDFGAPVELSSVRLWNGFDGVRSAEMEIRASATDPTGSLSAAVVHTFDFGASDGGGSTGTNHTGWYQYNFTPTTAQYWQLNNTGVTQAFHMPRTGGVEFGQIPEPSTLMLTGLGLLGLVAWRRRRR